jgi:hypothetical protein
VHAVTVQFHQRASEQLQWATLSRLCANVLLAALVACANTTPVLPAASSKSQFDGAAYAGETVELDKRTPGAEVYRVFQQGATGFVSIASVRGGVEEIATQHCARRGKVVRPVEETSSKPPYILGNFPRVEWVFECADGPTSMGSAAPPKQAPDKLTQLERLKKLLDSGALTQAEYDAEKAKILATQ